jgi:hypothetical protein
MVTVTPRGVLGGITNSEHTHTSTPQSHGGYVQRAATCLSLKVALVTKLLERQVSSKNTAQDRARSPGHAALRDWC